ILTSIPIADMLKTSSYSDVWVVWGIAQGIVGIAAALGLRTPAEGSRGASAEVAKTELQSRRSYAPKEMLRNPIFYLLFIMMTMMSTGGLMIVSNLGPIAKEFKVADIVVLGTAALPLALTVDRITNGLTRPFFGWVSDRIGRESTMALAFF